MKKAFLLASLLCLTSLLSPALSAQVKNQDLNDIPVADYDEAEGSPPEEQEKRKVKNKRYDEAQLTVSKDPKPYYTGLSVFPESPSLPAIPAAESQIVIIGEVLKAEAYLSNNKAHVYSEFTVRIGEVLKSNDSQKFAQNSLITMDRLGGFVRYRNGQKLLYTVVGKGYPQVGERYMFFLTNTDQSLNFYILTGYRLMEGKIYPLDMGLSEKFEGMEETNFIKKMREALTQPTKTPPTITKDSGDRVI